MPTPPANTRLTFLIVESEPPQGLSTRKLLVETAKHNVLTAYDAHEGIQTLTRFPAVDAIVFDMGVRDMECENFVKTAQKMCPQIKVVGLASTDAAASRAIRCTDFVVSSHDPAALLKLLEKEFGARPLC